MENNPKENTTPARPPRGRPLTREEYLRRRIRHARAAGAQPKPGKPQPTQTRPEQPRPTSQPVGKKSIYHTYKLIGGIMLAAVALAILLTVIFSNGGQGTVPALSAGRVTAPSAGDDGFAGGVIPTDTADTDYSSYIVCIDPGHGYDDPGATYKPTLGDKTEKELTLDIALLLAARLEKQGFTVIMSRPDDVKPDDSQYIFNPFDRVDFVNAHPDIDLFISLHCDAYTEDTAIGGTRIYLYDGGVAGTTEYASALSTSLGESLKTEVPVIGKNMAEAYYVTKMLSMPSVLIEMGFITNAVDAGNLLSDKWRDDFTAGAVRGIIDYINARG